MQESTGIRAGATVNNTAGSSTQRMQKSRYIMGLIASYGLGALAIVSIGVFGAVKYLERFALEKARRGKDAERGAEAEEAVGAILDNLPAGNFIIHDFNSGKGNIDHILMCPKGIFTLETKSHAGKVSFDGKKLLRNGRKFEKDFLNQAWAQCYLVKAILARRGITNLQPEPIILFTKAFVQVRGKATGIHILGINDFPKFLERLPDTISVPEAGRIYDRIKAASNG